MEDAMSIYTVKSKWNGETSRLTWLVLKGAAVIARRDSEREAKKVMESLRVACDPWQAFNDARQAAYNRGMAI
jgi:hypothetical protein